MKLRMSLIAIILALPFLYVTGALWRDTQLSTWALLFIAALCFWLLTSERSG